MAWIWKDRVGQAVSGSPGTGAITLGSALSAMQALAAGDDGGLAFFYVKEGTAWQTFVGTYTHSGTSVARTIPLDGSGGLYTNVSFTSAAEVRIALNAQAAYMSHLGGKGGIDGLTLLYVSTSAVNIVAGTAAINGKVLSMASTTFTSGTTMLDLAGSTVTLGNSKAYYVFAFDNAGTLTVRFEEADGTGDGGTVAVDADFGYHKAASTGRAARRIGHIWTNSSGQILGFVMVAMGRCRSMRLTNTVANGLLSLGTQTSFTSLTITPWVTPDIAAYHLLGSGRSTSGAQRVGVFTSIDSGAADTFAEFLIWAGAINNDYLTAFPVHPNTGLLYYRTIGANTNASIWICGTEFFV